MDRKRKREFWLLTLALAWMLSPLTLRAESTQASPQGSKPGSTQESPQASPPAGTQPEELWTTSEVDEVVGKAVDAASRAAADTGAAKAIETAVPIAVQVTTAVYVPRVAKLEDAWAAFMRAIPWILSGALVLDLISFAIGVWIGAS